MSNFLKSLANKIGINKAIVYTIFSRVIQVGGGIITLIFVANYLNKVEQGYYYTFGSILAIQIFFELGLSGIITQFVAHENAYLKWEDDTSFIGSPESSSRLASLLRFSIKWFGVIAILLFFGLLITGYFFFETYGRNDNLIDWQIPWVILSITTSLSLMLSPILAFFEGLGRVKEVARIRMMQQIVQLCILLILFLLGFKLFSAPLAALLSFFIVPFWIYLGNNKRLLVFIWNNIGQWEVNYFLEIFPYQWKIALSWISGYFIFQLFNPVLFASEGADVAGQMGMTLAVLNAIFSLSFSWITTRVPFFSRLIAQKDFTQLDEVFNRTLLQSTLLNVFGLIVFFSLIFAMGFFNFKIADKNIYDRFLPILPMIFMMIPILLNHIVSSWATYLRCHKKEPMLLQSVVIGILCALSTIIFGKDYGVLGLTLGYMILSIISFIWAYFIFITKKKEWHNA